MTTLRASLPANLLTYHSASERASASLPASESQVRPQAERNERAPARSIAGSSPSECPLVVAQVRPANWLANWATDRLGSECACAIAIAMAVEVEVGQSQSRSLNDRVKVVQVEVGAS